MTRGLRCALVAVCTLLAASAGLAARNQPLALRHWILDLPGPPARVISSDLDGDGRRDLIVVLVYSEVDEIMEERLENLAQVMTVIPAVFDRREVRAYLGTEAGDFVPAGPPLELPPSVLHLQSGPPGTDLVALTDKGLSRLSFDREAQTLGLTPLVEDPPILAGSGSFYARLDIVHDLNADGLEDVLLPSRDSLAVYLGTKSGLATTPVQRIELPHGGSYRAGWLEQRSYPLPEVLQLDGDGIPDLLFQGGFNEKRPTQKHVFLGSAAGPFRPLRQQPRDCHDELTDVRISAPPEGWPWPQNLVALRDIDGDGRAEAVLQLEKPRGDSFRKSMKDAKQPISEFTFHELNDDLSVAAEPYFRLETVGHTWESDPEDETTLRSDQFLDLDGDGRLDLITMTLDFSVFQALRVMTTKSISIGIEFHLYAQAADGTFQAVPDLDLSEKLKFDLDDLTLGRFAQFAGDFNGDGRQDFVHLGRGKTVTIHAGQPGCRYPTKPDLAITLDAEPASLDLVSIEDLDGDGRADLRLTRPLPLTDADATAPVRLDFYLSGGG